MGSDTRNAAAKPPTPDEAARVAEFRIALRRFLHQTEVVARETGITPRWYLLLLLIRGAPGGAQRATVTELSERMYLAQSSVTELVSRAEQAGLVERAGSDADRRVAYIRLTPEGERRLAQGFSSLAAERRALREAIADLDD